MKGLSERGGWKENIMKNIFQLLLRWSYSIFSAIFALAPSLTILSTEEDGRRGGVYVFPV